jgi:putative PIN family toxin of toxin-antitoxin system
MRLVFDCNVLISALLFNTSIPGQALIKAKSSFTILLSNHIFVELIEVLMRPKFDRYVSNEIRQLFFEEVKSLCLNVEITEHVKLCRDPKDDMYLELALSGKADCIIAGDKDLLVLNPFENIPIITPLEFLNRF